MEPHTRIRDVAYRGMLGMVERNDLVMTTFELITTLICLVLLTLGTVWIIGERGRLLLPSTRELFRKSGISNFFNGNSLHLYVYGRWTKHYIKTAVRHYVPRISTESRLGIARNYHSRTLTLEQAKKVININHDIDVRDSEAVIPYPVARDIILKAPVEIAIFDCPCRDGRQTPCEPVQVCMLFGEPIVSFILEHHPTKSRRLTREEALETLEKEHERGHVHTAWFKNVCLNRFFAICNCCKCCCGGMISLMRYGVPMILSSGFVAGIDYEKCVACGTCERFCQFEAISFDASPQVSRDKCMGCGVCVDKCPQSAISLEKAPDKGVPLEFDRLGQDT